VSPVWREALRCKISAIGLAYSGTDPGNRSSPASYLVVDKFILTTTNPCHTRTEDNLSINKNQFFLELPQSALPNGPQAISEGQILSIPYVDTVIHSMYSDFPLCTGALTVLPDPKVSQTNILYLFNC